MITDIVLKKEQSVAIKQWIMNDMIIIFLDRLIILTVAFYVNLSVLRVMSVDYYTKTGDMCIWFTAL